MHPYYIQQLMWQLQQQMDKIEQLERVMNDMRTDLDELKNKSTTTIERIEYNFDLLKIEKLEGTLNIGLTPTDGKSIDDLSVNGGTLSDGSLNVYESTPFETGTIPEIEGHVVRYLNEEVPQQIDRLKRERQLVLGDQYTQIVLNDIRSQVPNRIKTYVDQYQKQEGRMNTDELKDTVINQMKRDISIAVQTHMDQILHRKWDQDEDDSH